MKSNLAKDFRISSCISKIIILSLYKEKRLEQDAPTSTISLLKKKCKTKSILGANIVNIFRKTKKISHYF